MTFDPDLFEHMSVSWTLVLAFIYGIHYYGSGDHDIKTMVGIRVTGFFFVLVYGFPISILSYPDVDFHPNGIRYPPLVISAVYVVGGLIIDVLAVGFGFIPDPLRFVLGFVAWWIMAIFSFYLSIQIQIYGGLG